MNTFVGERWHKSHLSWHLWCFIRWQFFGMNSGCKFGLILEYEYSGEHRTWRRLIRCQTSLAKINIRRYVFWCFGPFDWVMDIEDCVWTLSMRQICWLVSRAHYTPHFRIYTEMGLWFGRAADETPGTNGRNCEMWLLCLKRECVWK